MAHITIKGPVNGGTAFNMGGPVLSLELDYSQVEELRAQLEVKKGLWKPKVGESYWTISESGGLYEIISQFQKDLDFRFQLGNYYKTREEAEKELNRRKALHKIREFIAENGLEFEPKGNTGYTIKRHINLHDNSDELTVVNSWNVVGAPLFFKSVEDAQKVIDNCEEELKSLL